MAQSGAERENSEAFSSLQLDGPTRHWANLVLERCGFPDMRATFDTTNVVSNAATPVSRQARHAGLQRLRSTLVTGTLLVATQDIPLAEFLLSSSFAKWRPLSAEMHFKIPYIVERIGPIDVSGCLRLFDKCFEFLLKSFEMLVSGEPQEALRVNCALAGMYMGPMLFGKSFRSVWRCALAAMKRCGLYEHSYLRMQLAVMGAYTGDCDEHRQWLLESGSQNMDLADILLFVRKDMRSDIDATQVSLLRGCNVSLVDCLYGPRPMTTLKLLVDYVCGCMRSTEHLTNGTLALMVLTWLASTPKLAIKLSATRNFADEHAGFLERLKKVNRVQVMEKKRFWAMVDKVENGPLRNQLECLWQTSAS